MDAFRGAVYLALSTRLQRSCHFDLSGFKKGNVFREAPGFYGYNVLRSVRSIFRSQQICFFFLSRIARHLLFDTRLHTHTNGQIVTVGFPHVKLPPGSFFILGANATEERL